MWPAFAPWRGSCCWRLPVPRLGAEASAARSSRPSSHRDQENDVFRLRVERPEGPSGARPRRRPRPRAGPSRAIRQVQEAMTPRFKTDATGALVPDIRAAAAIIFDPETRPGALGGERAGQALDRQHHQGHDRGGLPRRRSRTSRRSSPSSGATSTPRRPRISGRTSGSRSTNVLHLTLIASDNAAARVLARVSHGGTASFIERMNEKAVELGPREHDVHRPLGAARREHLVGLRSVAADHLRRDRRAIAPIIAPIMRTADYKVATSRRMITIHSTNRLVHGRRRRSDGREDGLHLARRATAWRRCCGCRRATQVAVVVLGATLESAAASGRRGTCSTGSRRRRAELFRQRTATSASHQSRLGLSRAPETRSLKPYLISLLHRCRVQRQRRHRIHGRHDRARRASGVVRLEVALADVARVEAVLAVAARERRDAAAVGVQAERAGELMEAATAPRSGRRSAGARRRS